MEAKRGNSMICKKCGSEVAEDDVFCMQCGEKIERQQCPHCGAEVDEDTVFCSNCGEKIGQERCPHCGSELEENSKFCVFCGAKLDGTEKPQTNTVSLKKTEVNPQPDKVEVNPTPKQNYSNKPKNKIHTDTSNKKWFLILAVVAIAVILAGVYFGNKAATKPAEKSTVSEEKNTADQSNNDSEASAESKTTNESKSYSNNNNTYTAPVRRENFDDYMGSWVTFLDNGKPIYFEIWKNSGNYWFSMDASTSSRALYAETMLDHIDEYSGTARGEEDDEFSYLSAYINFKNGKLILTASMHDKYLDYKFDFDAVECRRWTADDEAEMNEYIFPLSNIEYLKEYELTGLSKDELKIARNEIYARHGRMFNDANLQAYFNSCSWYTPSISPENFSDSMLNEVEIANRDLIVSYETEMGYR